MGNVDTLTDDPQGRIEQIGIVQPKSKVMDTQQFTSISEVYRTRESS